LHSRLTVIPDTTCPTHQPQSMCTLDIVLYTCLRSDIDECMVHVSIHLCVATIACLQLCFTILIIPKGVNQYRTTIHYVRQIRLPLVQILTKPSNMIPERSLIQNPDINTTTPTRSPIHKNKYNYNKTI